MNKEPLLTFSYCCILAANFLLYFGFYMIMPILPFYLTEYFHTDNAIIGIVLSCYTIAALTIRPFSGYLLDTLARKPLYIISYLAFTMIFVGYILAGALTLFIILRIIHGFAFGTVTVSGNTVVIDIMPASRRGEGLGYYGLSNNIAMAVGPMVGLFLHDFYSFNTIFITALSSCALGLISALLVKTEVKPSIKSEPISLDRFVLVKGIPAGIALLLLSIPYGMTTTFVAVYAKEIGINRGTGIFFTLMAIGMAISRLFSGRQVDKGRITKVITFGLFVVSISFFIFSFCEYFMLWNPEISTYIFFATALFLGAGFGTMFPAFNALFVNLAPNNKRGTATSTYLTSWDVGIGTGLLLGGFIAQVSTFSKAYLLGAILCVISTFYFIYIVGPNYEKNKLR